MIFGMMKLSSKHHYIDDDYIATLQGKRLQNNVENPWGNPRKICLQMVGDFPYLCKPIP